MRQGKIAKLAIAALLAAGCWRAQGLGNDAPSDDDASTDSDSDTCTAGTFSGLAKAYNDELVSALAGYTEIDGDLWIGNGCCPEALSDLAELACLRRVTGEVRLLKYANIDFSGLENLERIDGDLAVTGDSFFSLQGLEGLKTVGGDLDISEAPNLASIESLNELQTVGGRLVIRQTPYLTSIESLSGLHTVGGLFLSSIYALQSLHGLEGIVSVGGEADESGLDGRGAQRGERPGRGVRVAPSHEERSRSSASRAATL
jgi:hypothetical protein